MVLIPKVKKPIDDKARENFINAGTTDNPPKETSQWTNIILRIKRDALNDVDAEVKKRMGLSRNAWILEAIQEKLTELNGRGKIQQSSGDRQET